MAKIKGLDKFKDTLLKAIDEVRKPSNMQAIGEETARRIKVRTRSGKSVTANDTQPVPLKKLSDNYVLQRKKDKKKGKLADSATPRRSNLTRTGQMLDSLSVTSKKHGSVKVGATGNRKEGNTNKNVAGYVSDSRPFLNLSTPEINGITKLIREKLDEQIKKLLTKK